VDVEVGCASDLVAHPRRGEFLELRGVVVVEGRPDRRPLAQEQPVRVIAGPHGGHGVPPEPGVGQAELEHVPAVAADATQGMLDVLVLEQVSEVAVAGGQHASDPPDARPWPPDSFPRPAAC